MRINEFAVVGSGPDAERIAAMSQFLVGRAQDTGARRTISTETFINLARAQGISLTAEQLKDMIQRPPLNNIIADVTGDDNNSGEIVFRGADVGAGKDTMTVDQAQATVDNMAKRAAKKGI
jgi:hypothetical protein